jgi:hypothetical protein
MYSILDAHFLSIVIVVNAIMVTPIYVIAVYVFSGASAKKGFLIGCGFLIWGFTHVLGLFESITAQAGAAGKLYCAPGLDLAEPNPSTASLFDGFVVEKYV